MYTIKCQCGESTANFNHNIGPSYFSPECCAQNGEVEGVISEAVAEVAVSDNPYVSEPIAPVIESDPFDVDPESTDESDASNDEDAEDQNDIPSELDLVVEAIIDLDSKESNPNLYNKTDDNPKLDAIEANEAITFEVSSALRAEALAVIAAMG